MVVAVEAEAQEQQITEITVVLVGEALEMEHKEPEGQGIHPLHHLRRIQMQLKGRMVEMEAPLRYIMVLAAVVVQTQALGRVALELEQQVAMVEQVRHLLYLALP